MDENRNDCFLCRHPFLKTLLVALMVFLGAYLAFYVVTDWHYKRMLDPAVQMRKVERMMRHDERQYERMLHNEMKKGVAVEKGIQRYIHVERTPGDYKIFIDLKPFNNNEKNIEVSTEGNSVRIDAAAEKTKFGQNEIIRISQIFSFDEKVDLSKMSEVREGNEYIITIPVQ